eukprot:TRINITY_DN2358_c1_g1_i2.p1 TRINITY_DN2358_c1_g1~~TRINITY_DN2358_c1_g1_i2.p1  ORF type:complete len:242 (+),score=42.58 TRINITY_DN2358_c1_g1_i2:77-802(+)
MSDKAVDSDKTEQSTKSVASNILPTQGRAVGQGGRDAEEYQPLKKKRKMSLFVKPGLYDPGLERGVVASGGWSYDPQNSLGKWESSYLPPIAEEGSKGNVFARELERHTSAITGGDLPLIIHDSLQQLRTQLLGDDARDMDLNVEETNKQQGELLGFTLLDNTCVTVASTGPLERGNAATPVTTFPYTPATDPAFPECPGVNTQLHLMEDKASRGQLKGYEECMQSMQSKARFMRKQWAKY